MMFPKTVCRPRNFSFLLFPSSQHTCNCYSVFLCVRQDSENENYLFVLMHILFCNIAYSLQAGITIFICSFNFSKHFILVSVTVEPESVSVTGYKVGEFMPDGMLSHHTK